MSARRFLTVLALTACSLPAGCHQTAARLNVTDRRPANEVVEPETAKTPIVREVPDSDGEQRAATNTARRPRTVASTSAARHDGTSAVAGIGEIAERPRIRPETRSQTPTRKVVSVGFDEQDSPPAATPDSGGPLQVPNDLPGAESSQLRIPAYDADQPLAERREAIRDLYETLPQLPAERVVAATSNERSLTLVDLQQTAYNRSPIINRAWAQVDSSRGRAVQAGLCPNPVVGYEGDTINTLNTAGYNGMYFEQTYITAGKLGLAQQAALMEVRANEYAYRRARIEVATAVRRAYFGVLVAQERVRLARAMATLTEEAYDAQVDLVAGGQAAAYEPLQLKVIALRARNEVVTAENAYSGRWRELAAAINYPAMLPEAVSGSVESPPGSLQFDSARAALLSRHTDISIAQADIAQQQYNLELQRVTPIPNLELYSAIQHDDTNSRNDVSYNVQIGLPLPIFNRNQGNIASANAELVRAQHNRVSTQNNLSAQLAEAFARYETARELAATYRTQIVPSQVQTFRGVYTQFRSAGGETDFAQVIVSQQTLAQVLSEYLDTLTNEWDAAVDVAELLQVEDIYTMDGLAAPPPLEPAPAGGDDNR